MKKAELVWLGQSFFKIITPEGKIILVDPWQNFPPGNNLFPKEFAVGVADVILITHGHLDHLGDAVALGKSTEAKPDLKIVSIFEIMIYLLEQGVSQEKLQPMNKGGSVRIGDITITMVDAVHSSGIGAFAPKSLTNGGESSGFVIALPDGTKIYHAGDTSLFGDMKLIGELYKPDVALLPIGNVFTMGPEDAARAVSLINPRIAIPMHFGGTFALPGNPEEFSKAVKKTGAKTKVVVLRPGEPVEI